MPDEPDPPRKIYGLKSSADFKRVNATTDQPGDGPTDVAGLIASANLADLATKANAPVNRPNDVHAILQENLQHDAAAGLHKVSLAPNRKRRRRIWGYWIIITAVDVPLAVMIWKLSQSVGRSPGSVVLFIFLVAAASIVTAVLTWQTWFLRTED
jgi:hypothetical protein